MKLIKAESPQCVVASFAMVLNETMESLIEQLGHNGMERILDENAPPEPYCFRSFHPQEFVDILLLKGYSMTMVERHPALMHGNMIIDHTPLLGEERFFEAFLFGDGVVFGTTAKMPHAVAWCKEERQFYDPRGYKWAWNKDQDFNPLQFFLIEDTTHS